MSPTPAPWRTLRRFTDARIALGRAGHSLPTAEHLAFQLAHAQARDAVHLPFDATGTAEGLRALGLEVLLLHSAAADRAAYLQRPDLGRRLDDASAGRLAALGAAAAAADAPRPDLALVVADGLSALAVHGNAVPLAGALLGRLRADARPWRLAPAVVVEQGRVAIGDPVGEALRAQAVVVLLGERPGLSAPDSLGVYMTWQPCTGLTDAARNCISNVRPAGLGVDAAAAKLHQLLGQMRARGLSGVALKDEAEEPPALAAEGRAAGFLLGPG